MVHPQGHFPVMLPEVIAAMTPSAGEVYVDGTFGAGGYARGLLDAAACEVIGVDRDPDAEKRAASAMAPYAERFRFVAGCFGDVAALLNEIDVPQVDGLVLDLGVSSFQIDQAERGFSFRFDGALDMRMNYGSSEETAADIVNTYDETELANIIYKYGEERHSRRIARKIVERRAEVPFETTFDLADVVRGCVPKSRGHSIDPATRTFQALRIAVNDELGELERALDASIKVLKPGGRLVVVTFHSLEDAIVKRFMREHAGVVGGGSRHLPEVTQDEPLFSLIYRKAVAPSAEEVAVNSRSRSAKLRAARRTEAPCP